MEELVKAIDTLKNYCQEIREANGAGRAKDFESKIRNTARKCLVRNDLRLTTEILFNDIYNAFSGFDRFDPKTRMEIIDETLEKIDRLIDMTHSDDAVKDVPSKLPPPPEYAVKAVERELQMIEDEKQELEQRTRKREIARKSRPQPPESERRHRPQQSSQPSGRPNRPKRPIPHEKPSRDNNNGESAAHENHHSPSADRKPSTRRPYEEKQDNRGERKKQPPVDDSKANERKPKQRKQPRPQEPITVHDLGQSVIEISGIGKVMAEKLKFKNVETVRDLLFFLPRDYEDRRNIVPLSELTEGAWCTSVVNVDRVSIKHLPKGRDRIIVVNISDKTGQACCKFFGGRIGAIKGAFPVGEQVLVSGEVERFRNGLEFHHPDSEKIPSGTKPQGKIIGIYSETEGLTRRRIRGFIRNALDRYTSSLSDAIPENILSKHQLLSSNQALEMIHFPLPDVDMDLLKIQASEGHRRLVFEELFLLQLGVFIRRKNHRSKNGIAFSGKPEIVKQLTSNLPFQLTEAQKKAINQIVSDMKKNVPMNRLLQGDVGSGKTIVALFASASAMQDGYQVALMAPTELLAEQHFQVLSPFIEKMGFKASLLTGKAPRDEQEKVRKGLSENEINFVVGTHALIQEATKFSKLGLAIIDEQHRFGVSQRRKLVEKGPVPDLLTMTATPIPRTLAMTAYGDIDISVIDEKPIGRKPVVTHVLEAGKKSQAYEKVRQIIKSGQQGFIVFPVIAESDRPNLLAAESEAERLAKEEFSEFRIGLIHGKMKSEEREKTIRAFREKQLDLLVATTVIEVGIDIPDAAVMIVENAERFGLAQLHQLRGRIGRGDKQGECYFIARDTENQKSLERLKILETLQDGLLLAEKDLELRGQGDLLGTRQHGLPPLRFSDLARDVKLLEIARNEAEDMISKDPNLDKNPEHANTLRAVLNWWGGAIEQGRLD